jgi:hypothetical protein
MIKQGFKISTGTIRPPDGRTLKGYYLSAFEDAFARYLPFGGVQTDTTSQPAETKANGDFSKRHGESLCRFENPENPSSAAGCDVVTVQTPLSEGKNGNGIDLASDPASVDAVDGPRADRAGRIVL